jgi:hypothetical protein
MAETSGDNFFKRLNESQFGQLIEFGSRLGGTYTFIKGAISLFEESDKDQILDAINRLSQDLDRDFKQLGSLITQQTQIIVDTVNRDAMATALSHTDAAKLQLQRFLDTGDMHALEFAENESTLGVQFFANLGPAIDPFFVPGLIKAGGIRLVVIGAEPPSFRSMSANAAQERQMTELLESAINSITQKINLAHTVSQDSHVKRCPPDPLLVQLLVPEVPDQARDRMVFVVVGFAHNEDGVRLAFFRARSEAQTECEESDPFEVDRAQSLAQASRDKGVADELSSLGVDGYRQVLEAWKQMSRL